MDQVVVAVRDGLDREAADAGPGEDGFGDDCAGEQRAELQAQHGDDGDHGVAQGVAVDDGALGQAFGAGGADVVLAELFEHRGAHHAGEDGGERSAHGEGGENEVGERAGAGDGEPSELDGEEQDQDRAEREVGERQAEEADDGEQRGRPSDCGAGRSGLRRGSKDDRDEQRCQREAQRVGIALGDQARDALVVAERGAEVAVQDAFPVVDVLLAERGVEAVGVARGGDVGGRARLRRASAGWGLRGRGGLAGRRGRLPAR